MSLLLSILASLVISLTPQASSIEPLIFAEVGVVEEYTDDFGDVGAEVEVEEETIDEATIEAFGFNPVEDAWFTFEKLQVPLSSSQTLTSYEYVASFEGSVPEFPSTYFTLSSPTHENVKHVFKVSILTAA